MKTIYKDEPVFKKAKVVYTVFDNQFDESLGKDFARKASLNHIDEEHLEPFTNADCAKLYKGAAHYSDALVVHEDATPDMKKYINKLSMPKMAHTTDDLLGEVYSEFYEQLIDQQN